MNIAKIKLPALRNEEHFQLMTDAKQEFEAEGPETLGIAPQFAIFVCLYFKEDRALEVIRKSALTDAITDADAARDNAYRGFVMIVETNRHSANPAKVQAAANIQVVIDHYGNFTHKSYNEETASIHNLLQDINTRCAADITVLNAQEWVDGLADANQTFNDLMNQRFDESAGQENINLRENRKDIDKAYNEIVDRINASILLNGEATHADFVKRLNERINYFKNTLARRKGWAHKKDKE
jgi:hypothetical protein